MVVCIGKFRNISSWAKPQGEILNTCNSLAWKYLTAHSHTGQSLGFNQQNHVWWFQFPLLCRKKWHTETAKLFLQYWIQLRQGKCLCFVSVALQQDCWKLPAQTSINYHFQTNGLQKAKQHKHQCMNDPLLHDRKPKIKHIHTCTTIPCCPERLDH